MKDIIAVIVIISAIIITILTLPFAILLIFIYGIAYLI